MFNSLRCLHLSECELVNDKVEQLLMQEVEIISESEVKLKKYIEAGDNEVH